MKSALTRSMTSGLEKTASRAAPAKTQQRASSIGRSMKIQSNTGLSFSRDSLSPSRRQLFHWISRHATFGRPQRFYFGFQGFNRDRFVRAILARYFVGAERAADRARQQDSNAAQDCQFSHGTCSV